MKQQTIKIDNRTFLVLDLPMDARDLEHSKSANWIRFLHNIHPKSNKEDGLMYGQPLLINLPVGDWQLLGFISELTDLQLWSIFGNEIIPASISEQKSYYENLRKRFTYELQSNGIMTVNPYPEATCSKLSDCTCDGMYINECRDSFLKWQTDQSQLWENICLLEKV